MGAASGQDADTAALLATDATRIALCMPDVCVMEAWYGLRGKQKEFNNFRSELSRRIREAQRDATSPNAAALLPDMVRAEIQTAVLFNDIERRFRDTLRLIAARVELLPMLAST